MRRRSSSLQLSLELLALTLAGVVVEDALAEANGLRRGFHEFIWGDVFDGTLEACP